MEFVVSSTELLGSLQSVSRVISSKNSLPILDNFLFELKDNYLSVTSSDQETTLRVKIAITNVTQEGRIALPAKLLVDSLKEFADQPLEFKCDEKSSVMEITWTTGNFKLPYTNADDYPEIPQLTGDKNQIQIDAQILLEGINRTLYATADEELRPVMNGLYFDISPDSSTIVASDAHKLVCYTRKDIMKEGATSFILPKKPASVLKNILMRSEEPVSVKFDTKNVYFEFGTFMMVSRLVEGNYPAYRSVIPKNNTNKLMINRIDFLNCAKRVSVCSNQVGNQIRLSLTQNLLSVSAQDLDFSTSAYEQLSCQYEGDEIDICFKSSFLIEILSNLPYIDISLELSDHSRPALIMPAGQTDPNEEITALIMPMMLGA